jgi:DNA-binding MarR family transcriptional regulator
MVAPESEDDELAAALPLGGIAYLLRRAHNLFQAYWLLRFRDSDTPITPVQGGVLAVLGANPGLSQTALARMVSVEGPTLMPAIDWLEAQGYLKRVIRLGDRRSYALQLTPRGREVLTAIEDFLPLCDADLLAGLTKREAKRLTRLLNKVAARP